MVFALLIKNLDYKYNSLELFRGNHVESNNESNREVTVRGDFLFQIDSHWIKVVSQN